MFGSASGRRTFARTSRVVRPLCHCWPPVRGPPAGAIGQPPQEPTPPTFRLGANYVRVDVYPTRNGVFVPDPADFELLRTASRRPSQFERLAAADDRPRVAPRSEHGGRIASRPRSAPACS
jgi:hypothetical protein